ncbi:MAG TPA: cytochrome P450 [Mycobacterium sp.]|nr:cytochrome P450 [Mycobacterium sp.]
MTATTPERATADLDLYDPDVSARRLEEWATLRAQCPVAYNPQHGGYWMLSRYDDIVKVSRDPKTFSSRYTDGPVDGIEYIGILGIPPPPRALGIGVHEVAEELHVPLRRAMNPYFSQSVAESLRPTIARYVGWFLDERIESGRIDAVRELAGPVAALLTMEIVGLPLSEWRYYVEVFQNSRTYSVDSPEAAALAELMTGMATTLIEQLESRRTEPQNDLLTGFVQFRKPDGQALTEAELLGQVWFVITGGLDTTTSVIANSLEYLAHHPEQRRSLIENPELMPKATEEFLRVFPVNETLTRTVTRDVELAGQQLHRGDHLLVSWLSANRDASVFEDPDLVILDRTPNPHLAFGTGPHRCIGMHVARMVFQVVLSEVLRRIPDYTVESIAMAPPLPVLNSVTSLVLRFPPGRREQPKTPPPGF